MSGINWKDKCWVTTIFLVNRDERVLLTWNKNMQTWIPVGGHIDEGETPQEAIRREVEEEVGCDFDLLGDFVREDDGDVQVVKMHRFQIEKVPHHGCHMNFVFFGKCNDFDKKIKKTDEGEKLKWFSKRELIEDKSILESVRKSALRALDVVRF